MSGGITYRNSMSIRKLRKTMKHARTNARIESIVGSPAPKYKDVTVISREELITRLLARKKSNGR